MTIETSAPLQSSLVLFNYNYIESNTEDKIWRMFVDISGPIKREIIFRIEKQLWEDNQ